MKHKFVLIVFIFCLILMGCQSISKSIEDASKESIQLTKDYSWNSIDNKYEKEISALISNVGDISKIKIALNRVIIKETLPDVTGKETYHITIVKDDGRKSGYELWKLSDDEYYVETDGPIDAQKMWTIKDVDMTLKGILEKYLK